LKKMSRFSHQNQQRNFSERKDKKGRDNNNFKQVS